jgi:hypothetical protein
MANALKWWPFGPRDDDRNRSRPDTSPAAVEASPSARSEIDTARPSPTGTGASEPKNGPTAAPAAPGYTVHAPLAGLADRFLLPDGVEGGRRLTYAEGAQVFLAWLQERGQTGETRRDRLTVLYAEHISELGLAWLAENHLFHAFGQLVPKHERSLRDAQGRRKRATTYDIPRRTSDVAAEVLLRRGVAA